MGEEIFQGEDKRSWEELQGCRKRDAGQRMVGNDGDGENDGGGGG